MPRPCSRFWSEPPHVRHVSEGLTDLKIDHLALGKVVAKPGMARTEAARVRICLETVLPISMLISWPGSAAAFIQRILYKVSRE